MAAFRSDRTSVFIKSRVKPLAKAQGERSGFVALDRRKAPGTIVVPLASHSKH
jgi:hypothetical protein